ncbi:MAG TPA: 7-cyano-7-deazaguanine synthase [Candidatus Nanoarchaeia archaeon]|nr:7-cyano-7-deazaguanine synthase [Candidatus Nanoarchaeia archaeon]
MKVISLLSGGLDSPVAVYMMLKQGCDVVAVHFHQQTSTNGAQNKVVKLVKYLKKFGNLKLYLVPFKDIQLELIKHVPAKVRMLVYRRFMFRIAELILKKESANALVTGDSLGQVASQTVENLVAVYSSVKSKIFTPLLGENKKDIVKTAREIGTYDLSILPYEDCCSFLVSPHPNLKSSASVLENCEQALDVESLVRKGFEGSRLADLD